MEQSTPTKWTVNQPWRGLFGVAVTVAYVFTITSIFKPEFFLGFYTLFIMSMVPILVVVGMGWGGQYPLTTGIPQPWRGFFLSGFVVLLGTLVCYALRAFASNGVAQPFINLYVISTVIVTFFLILAFGMWPFDKLPLGAKGWFTLILAFVVMWIAFKLFNFSHLSFPTGENPSAVAPVPFYAKGGPLEPFAALAPKGPFIWESAIAFLFWMFVGLFVFTNLGMWPFCLSKTLMKQPLFGIILTLTTIVFAIIAFLIGVRALKIEPLKFLLVGVCWVYGVLMIMTMFQMWPGRGLKQPGWGFVNIVLAIGVGIVAYYAYLAYANWHFGKAMAYPNNIFIMANMMLGITFPAWAAYSDLFDFWPLPPTPKPPEQ
jgi:hypothetical protein